VASGTIITTRGTVRTDGLAAGRVSLVQVVLTTEGLGESLSSSLRQPSNKTSKTACCGGLKIARNKRGDLSVRRYRQVGIIAAVDRILSCDDAMNARLNFQGLGMGISFTK